MSRQSPTVPQPQTRPSAGPPLHQYACQRCRARRIKCDKIIPECTHCASHGAQCLYAGRRPRGPGKAQQGQPTPQRSLLPASTSVLVLLHTTEHRAGSSGNDVTSHEDFGPFDENDDEDQDAMLPQELRDTAFKAQYASSKQDQGRLLVGPQGTSRYMNGDKVKQVAYLETIFAMEHREKPKESARSALARRSVFLDANSLLNALHNPENTTLFHPPDEIIHALWDYYRHNVDIMVKVLYQPAVEPLVKRAARQISTLDPTSETPLLFAICLATVTTMSSAECQQIHRADREVLIRKYRHALEQSLTQAQWMTTQSISVLQSVTLYLVYAAPNSRSTWILSGIALSLAQAMGMHLDSSSYSLNAIETEVRRRVWWMLCQIDVRVSQNCGLQPHVPFIMDTELPMHVNDSDLSSTDGKAVKPRNEITEMTLSLCKIEMTKTILRFKRSTLAKEEREGIVRDQLQRYEDIYLGYFIGQSEIHRLSRLGIRLLMTKLWNLIYGATDEDLVIEDFQESLVLYNADVLEIAHQLPGKYRQYGWFFSCKRTQWHAMAYLLIQMCKHTEGSTVDRAWEVLDATFADWREGAITASESCAERIDKQSPSSLWKSMLQLYEQACEVRRKSHLQREDSLSTHASSMASVEHEAGIILTGDLRDPQLPQADMIGDPFLGSVEELNAEMNWGQLDDWVQRFQDDIYQKDLEQHDTTILGTQDWW